MSARSLYCTSDWMKTRGVERVVDARPHQVRDEVAFAAGSRRCAGTPAPPRTSRSARKRTRRVDRRAIAGEEAAEERLQVQAERRALVGHQDQLRLGVVVGARRHEDARVDLERRPHPLAREVHAGVDLPAVLELPVVVEVRVTGLLETVEAPEAAVGGVRTHFLQLQELLRPETRHHANVGLAVAAARQEPDLRIELLAHLLVAGVEVPCADRGRGHAG